jgi:hypothetical protein
MVKTAADPEALSARIVALRARHADLEARIHAEQTRPLPSVSRLRLLKAHKLKLKDEMACYDGVVRTLSGPGHPA